MLVAADASAAEKPSVARIRAALGADTAVEFVDTPLSDVVGYLRDLHQVPIVVDPLAIAEIEPESLVVNMNVRGISLASALNLILEPFALDWMIHHEVLLITSPGRVSSTLEMRSFDVSDLVDEPEEVETLAEMVRLLKIGRVPSTPYTAGPPAWSMPPDPGPPVLAREKVLIVRGSRYTHAEVSDLLERLRSHREPVPVEVEVQPPPETVEPAPPTPASAP
jgi:hypothetical protein